MNAPSPWRIERLTPRTAPDATAATGHDHGTMSMFENAVFATLARHDDLMVVRKPLQ